MPQVIHTRPRTLRDCANFMLGWMLGLFGTLVLAFVLGLLMPSQRACAAELGVHLWTQHNGHAMPDAQGVRVTLRSFTPGLYVHLDNGVGLGVFRNSFGDPAVWGGYVLNLQISPRWEASAMVGGIAGYKHTAVMPALIPSLRLRVYGSHGVRVAYLAKKPGEAHSVDAIHLAYSRTLP